MEKRGNPFKFRGLRFSGGDLCGIDGKTGTFHVRLSGSEPNYEILASKNPHFCEEKGFNHANFVVSVFQGGDCVV